MALTPEKECDVMAIKDDTMQGGPGQPTVHNGTQQSVMSLQDVAVKEVPPIADPAPLGLAAFALTTFLLSAFNVGWTKGTLAFLGFALAYGGLAQLLAGMWEFRNRNVFGATAFSTYGAFWIAVYFFWVVPEFKPTALQLSNDLGWISVAFVIFNTYMLLWSLFVNRAVFLVFLTLEVTFILLAVGHFMNSTNMVKAGGIAGIVTAACAWYASAAGVINGMGGRKVLPTGEPLHLNPVQ
jgi:succinate-acetate transporter protein